MKTEMNLGSQLFARVSLLLMALALGACANTGRVQHGIQLESKGPRSIYDVRVTYGEALVRFRSIYGERQGSGQGVIHPVPDSMQVTWFVGGHPQEATVPLKTKLSRTRPLANWVLHFYCERLEVFRQDDDPANPVGRHPLVKIYPEHQSDWVGKNQAVLALDSNGAGQFEVSDLRTVNSLRGLDADGNRRIDATDATYAALRLFLDANRNAKVDAGEVRGLQDGGIVALDIGATQVTAVKADGNSANSENDSQWSKAA